MVFISNTNKLISNNICAEWNKLEQDQSFNININKLFSFIFHQAKDKMINYLNHYQIAEDNIYNLFSSVNESIVLVIWY